MKTTATDLRTHLFSWLDKIIYSGESLEIERKGVILKIQRIDETPRLSRLEKRPTLAVKPEELLDMDWSGEWNPES